MSEFNRPISYNIKEQHINKPSWIKKVYHTISMFYEIITCKGFFVITCNPDKEDSNKCNNRIQAFGLSEMAIVELLSETLEISLRKKEWTDKNLTVSDKDLEKIPKDFLKNLNIN